MGGKKTTKILKNQTTMHLKSNSTNSSMIKIKRMNEGTVNANVSTLLDASHEEELILDRHCIMNA